MSERKDVYIEEIEPILSHRHRLTGEGYVMKSYYITFRSVTFAQKAEGILKRAGIACTLRRTPKWMEERGCGYCLHLHRGELQSAVSLLRESGTAFRKVYAQQPSGALEEFAV